MAADGSKGFGLLAAAVVLSLGACRQDMHDQPRFEPLEKNSFFADGRSARPQVPGTIARGQLREDPHLYEGRSSEKKATPFLFPISESELEQALAQIAGEAVADTFPFPISGETLRRGRERFEIFCSPCHGRLGEGNGIVVRRGFRPPPSYHIDRLRRAPVGHFFDVITRGIGAMEDFSDRIAAPDRWAIAAHIRVLQFAHHAVLAELPASTQAEFRDFVSSRPPAPEFERAPAVPGLAADLPAELERLRSVEQARLESYGWVDRAHGIVRIPVARAAGILLKRGFPVRRPSPGGAPQ